jgi:putative membrane protein insertion efficiency factor
VQLVAEPAAPPAASLLPRLAQAAVIRALRVYKLVFSPLFPSACRYYPTCSEYMRAAVQEYGAVKGVWMGLRRLSRCHPLHEGGYDPVR